MPMQPGSRCAAPSTAGCASPGSLLPPSPPRSASSERYVHKLFERAGTTFASYVMDRRLDGAARDLKDPATTGRAIGDIAFDWGFSDLSHFTRRFRHRFGCALRDWRRG
ncbi:AraC-like DNA-binding protein [Bradyrhizobium sp. JR3.5]